MEIDNWGAWSCKCHRLAAACRNRANTIRWFLSYSIVKSEKKLEQPCTSYFDAWCLTIDAYVGHAGFVCLGPKDLYANTPYYADALQYWLPVHLLGNADSFHQLMMLNIRVSQCPSWAFSTQDHTIRYLVSEILSWFCWIQYNRFKFCLSLLPLRMISIMLHRTTCIMLVGNKLYFFLCWYCMSRSKIACLICFVLVCFLNCLCTK